MNKQYKHTHQPLLRILLSLLSLLFVTTQPTWAQTKYYSVDIYAESYAGGDGSKTNPYKIATAADSVGVKIPP